MKTFLYKCYDENRIKSSGTIIAKNKKDAAKILENKYLKVISLKEKRTFIKLEKRVFKNYKTLYIFASEWASLIESGLSVIETLDILEMNWKEKEIKVIRKIKNSITSGFSISESLEKTSEFPSFFISMVKIGEATGTLPLQLETAADYYKKEHKMRKKLTELFAYPVTVLIFSLIVLYVIMTLVIPVFYELYQSMSFKLPASTEFIFETSFFLKDFGIYILLFILLLFTAIGLFIKTEKGKNLKNDFLYKFSITKNIFVSRFCMYLAILSESGYTIYDSLENIQNSMKNDKSKSIVKRILSEIKKGATLPKALEKVSVFDKTSLHLIFTGCESGRLPYFLKLVTERKEEEFSRRMLFYKTILQPSILIFCGILTAFILLSVWLPMINIFNGL